jgi:mono/diheme cytochrome c family protein
MKMKFKLTGGMMIAAAVLVLGSCASDPDSAGLEYMPDMYRSAAVEPYVDYGQIKERENPELKEKLSAKIPPFGTIPFVGIDSAEVALMMPYFRNPEVAFASTHGLFGWEYTDGQYEAAVNDLNPLAYDTTLLETGKMLYQNNCIHCHGEKGDGNGKMMQNGTFTGVPDYATVKDKGDGQLFYSIYYGKGAMGAHGPQLNKKEIWTLVHYIRKFQNPDYNGSATIAPVAANDTITE